MQTTAVFTEEVIKKEIRETLAEGNPKSTVLGIVIFLVAITGYGLFLAGTLALRPTSLRVLSSFLAGVSIGSLFVIGHDACHGTFTSSRILNAIIGRIAFLPSLHAYSLWELGHNQIHHGYTNLRGKDYSFAPLSKTEFDALPTYRRFIERCYRSIYGHWLFYLYEIWWRRMFFPKTSEVGQLKQIYWLDSILVLVYLGVRPSNHYEGRFLGRWNEC